jgi:hypothetical protein
MPCCTINSWGAAKNEAKIEQKLKKINLTILNRDTNVIAKMKTFKAPLNFHEISPKQL